MKVVALSQRVDVFPERGESRDAIDQRLISFCLLYTSPSPRDRG